MINLELPWKFCDIFETVPKNLQQNLQTSVAPSVCSWDKSSSHCPSDVGTFVWACLFQADPANLGLRPLLPLHVAVFGRGRLCARVHARHVDYPRLQHGPVDSAGEQECSGWHLGDRGKAYGRPNPNSKVRLICPLQVLHINHFTHVWPMMLRYGLVKAYRGIGVKPRILCTIRGRSCVLADLESGYMGMGTKTDTTLKREALWWRQTGLLVLYGTGLVLDAKAVCLQSTRCFLTNRGRRTTPMKDYIGININESRGAIQRSSVCMSADCVKTGQSFLP